MLDSFYHELEEPEELPQLLSVTRDIVDDFDEIYDLDVLWRDYRNVYDKCRHRLRLDEDYRQLREKAAAIRLEVEVTSRLQTEASLRIVETGAVLLAIVVLIADFSLHDAVDHALFRNSVGIGLIVTLFVVIGIGFAWLVYGYAIRWRRRRAAARRFTRWRT
jgi:hypothetical protein